MDIRELTPDQTHLAWEAMAELRPHLPGRERFVSVVNERQRPDGYRLLGSFESGGVVAAAGFRRSRSLAWGDHLYIDDLGTLEAFRGRGHARFLLDWISEEASRLGCEEVHLDSGTHRLVAHRQYLKAGYDIVGFHFRRAAPSAG